MYSDMSDNELLDLIHEGKDNMAMETLIKRYGPLVTRQSRSLYIIGADEEDIIQEGMIGLVKAVNDYKPDKGASFKTFAYMCVRRQLITAVNSSNNKKNGPLNSYVSIYSSDADITTNAMSDTDGGNPEDIMLARLRESTLLGNIESRLSKLEKSVLSEYLTGASYEEIGEKLGKPAKSIDNAIQRIRAKLRNL